MRTAKFQNGKPAKGNFISLCAIGMMFCLFACTKEAQVPQTGVTPATAAAYAPQFTISTSKVVLLETNDDNRAVEFSWAPAPHGSDETVKYTIEAAVGGSQFSAKVDVGITAETGIIFTVKDFNRQMRKIISAGNNSRVDFRVRTELSFGNRIVYSNPMALEVTAYQHFIEYSNSQIIRVPGNFQEWKLAYAPKVISASTTGEYEGYINFTNPYSQFLMVKGTTEWDPKVTYNYIGADKFGFGGSVFSIFGGSGVYRLKVNTGNNTWSYTKINTWALNGTAVSTDAAKDAVMENGDTPSSWRITANLAKGDFHFRANGSDAINFGSDASGNIGVPAYNGSNIKVPCAGNYTIALDLNVAGNYVYTITKNN